MSIKAYLNAPHNTVVRERLFLHRLLFDLRFGAAGHNYDLVVFEAEVDKDGYDVVFDDGDNRVSVQLKSKLKTTSTNVWEIHRRMLLPSPIQAANLPSGPMELGIGGGVIVTVLDETQPLAPATYLYTNYAIMRAFELGVLFEKSPKSRGSTAKKSRYSINHKYLADLTTMGNRGKIKIPRSAFVKAKGASELLALCGLSSPSHGYDCMTEIINLEASGFNSFSSPKPSGASAGLAKRMGAYLLGLIDEPRLIAFS